MMEGGGGGGRATVLSDCTFFGVHARVSIVNFHEERVQVLRFSAEWNGLTQAGPSLPMGTISRKPASLEARLEVFLLVRPKGVVWVSGPNPVFALFRVHFQDPFRSTFS